MMENREAVTEMVATVIEVLAEAEELTKEVYEKHKDYVNKHNAMNNANLALVEATLDADLLFSEEISDKDRLANKVMDVTRGYAAERHEKAEAAFLAEVEYAHAERKLDLARFKLVNIPYLAQKGNFSE